MIETHLFEIAWFLVVEEKTCKATKGVTIVPNEPFTDIVDCASACKAKLQNTMFAFENKNGCKESKTGCQCHCIESVTNDCTTKDEAGFTLYKFKTEKSGESFFNLISKSRYRFKRSNNYFILHFIYFTSLCSDVIKVVTVRN